MNEEEEKMRFTHEEKHEIMKHKSEYPWACALLERQNKYDFAGG